MMYNFKTFENLVVFLNSEKIQVVNIRALLLRRNFFIALDHFSNLLI